jgi:hypothetical protein
VVVAVDLVDPEPPSGSGLRSSRSRRSTTSCGALTYRSASRPPSSASTSPGSTKARRQIDAGDQLDRTVKPPRLRDAIEQRFSARLVAEHAQQQQAPGCVVAAALVRPSTASTVSRYAANAPSPPARPASPYPAASVIAVSCAATTAHQQSITSWTSLNRFRSNAEARPIRAASDPAHRKADEHEEPVLHGRR